VDTGALIPCLLLGPEEGDVDEDEDSGGVGVAGRQKVRADAGDEAGRRWARTPATRTAGGGELDAADPALRWRDAAASTVVWCGVRDGAAVWRGVRDGVAVRRGVGERRVGEGERIRGVFWAGPICRAEWRWRDVELGHACQWQRPRRESGR